MSLSTKTKAVAGGVTATEMAEEAACCGIDIGIDSCEAGACDAGSCDAGACDMGACDIGAC